MAINHCVLLGRLTNELELRSTSNGISVLTFTLAVTRKYRAKGEERQADFINCVAYRNTAEFLSSYFKKGSPVAIVGSIQTRSYEDKEGKKRYITEVIVNEVNFVEGNKENAVVEVKKESDNTSDINSDDFPF